MCGSVRYEVIGESEWSGYCHCNSCRRHTGAPVVAFVTFPVERVRWTKGERGLYESSPGRFRAFCRDCGASLTWENGPGSETSWGDRAVIEFHISTLDDPDAFPQTMHLFHGERISWFDVDDALPRHATLPEVLVE
jgi:hypothetical protein